MREWVTERWDNSLCAVLSFYFCLCYYLLILVITGVSANADPHTNKLRTRVAHIWGYRRRQLNRSAMEEPLPGETACLITVFPVPGKYAGTCRSRVFSNLFPTLNG